MKSLRYLNVILTVLAVLLTLQLWTVWNGHGTPIAAAPSIATPALAQSRGPTPGASGIPDAGAQRREMVDLLKKLVVQTDEVKSVLTSGQVRVRVENPPKEAAGR